MIRKGDVMWGSTGDGSGVGKTGLFKVVSTHPSLVVRGLRWYERAWSWLKRKAKR